MKLSDLIKILDALFSAQDAWENDNTGFQAGWLDRDVKKILVTLDITNAAIDEAISSGANLIISHHPLIFEPLYSITSDDPAGAKMLKLIENRISVYIAHTNYDAMKGGLNDLVFEFLGLKDPEVIEPLLNKNNQSRCATGFGRLGSLSSPKTLDEIMVILEEKLGLKNMQWLKPSRAKSASKKDLEYRKAEKISKIAVINGSANSLANRLSSPELDCDLVIAGELKYSNASMIAESGRSVIVAGHAETEKLAIDGIYDRIKKSEKLKDIDIIKSEKGYFLWRYYIE